MIIACLGDSLTEGDYGVFGKRGIADVKAENYPYFLSKLLHAEVRNYGKCGYTASNYLEYYTKGNVSLEDVDVILVMLGTNGGHDGEAETQANLDYKKLIDLCKKDAPNAKIVLCTPPHATSNPQYSNCGYEPQVRKAVDFVRKSAKDWGLDLIDVAKCPEFTDENEPIMQPNDGLHFGKTGYSTLARFIADGLKAILNGEAM